MKFITTIGALALLTGSIDVEAQQRKNLNKKSGRSEKHEAHQIAREVAEDGQQQQEPLVDWIYDQVGLLEDTKDGKVAVYSCKSQTSYKRIGHYFES